MEKVKVIIDELDFDKSIVYINKGEKNIWKVLCLFEFITEMEYWGMPAEFKKVNGKGGFIFSNKIDKDLLLSEINRFIYDNKIEQEDFDL